MKKESTTNKETIALQAITPIDGRYKNKIEELGNYFSEFALIRYRVRVEIEYFIALTQIPLPQLKGFPKRNIAALRKIYEGFNLENACRVKEIERTTNHDVKAVEYYIKEQFKELKLEKFSEFIHFGLTSQDINNSAIPLSLKEAVENSYMPLLEDIIATIDNCAKEWKDIPMLAHTHGQPATPTKVGKEFKVFVARLKEQLTQLKRIPYSSKFGGATGNFNAHYVAYPNIDWNKFANDFQSDIGLKRSYPTTQIEHYDNIASLFDNLKRINTILIDLCRDIWSYISMEYFKQKIKGNEVGSSAMPHKVNPIDFENAEGNLGIANAIFSHIACKLPISRLQRDLTDSTVLRNIGVPIAHTQIALHSIKKGIGKLIINKEKITEDLNDNQAVVAEAIQTILRREGYPHPYEVLKELTRKSHKIERAEIEKFIKGLDISESTKRELLKITPLNYTGK